MYIFKELKIYKIIIEGYWYTKKLLIIYTFKSVSWLCGHAELWVGDSENKTRCNNGFEDCIVATGGESSKHTFMCYTK